MACARTPREAAERYRAPFIEAVRCIAHGSPVTARERHYEAAQEYSVALNNGDPLRLRSSPAIYLSAGQRFRIVQADAASQRMHQAYTIEYWYLLTLDNRVEVLAFHWTPEAAARGLKTYPHLHIGAAMLSPTVPVFPETFHKKHLPSGRVSIESIVRFAIEELEIPPLKQDWTDILERGQRRFELDRH